MSQKGWGGFLLLKLIDTNPGVSEMLQEPSMASVVMLPGSQVSVASRVLGKLSGTRLGEKLGNSSPGHVMPQRPTSELSLPWAPSPPIARTIILNF